MARSLWTGSLSFALVNVPVSLVTAVRDLDLHFRQVHAKDGAPIDVHADVDPIYFDHPYFLVPASEDDGSARAYRLLAEVMGKTERAALGRFVMRAQEYLAIVRERDGSLTLTTMMFADEVRDPKGVDRATQKAHKPTPKQLDAAVAVIEELSCEWDPGKHKDRYRARLKRVVDRKRKGQTIKAPEAAEAPAPPEDLMAALERTLADIKDGGSGRWSDRREAEEAE